MTVAALWEQRVIQAGKGRYTGHAACIQGL
jgi:hypothetical protein